MELSKKNKKKIQFIFWELYPFQNETRISNRGGTLPKSPIGLAIAYCLTHWDGLLTYLTDGRIEIDNNATERDIKPFVIARKNFLFACTPQGADSLGVHFSLDWRNTSRLNQQAIEHPTTPT